MDEIAKEYDVIVLGTGMSLFPTPQCGVRLLKLSLSLSLSLCCN